MPIDAVHCAVAIQRQIAAHQRDVAARRRVIFRIGINLGDVVVTGDDLLGDGVNIAARLEQLCPAGGVLVSGTACHQLRGKLDLPVDFAGDQRVKNISQPVRTYSIRIEEQNQPGSFVHAGYIDICHCRSPRLPC